MSNYIIHDGVLCREDELCHYKYIKREKVGGRWKYYYKDTKLDAAKANLDKLSAEERAHRKTYDTAKANILSSATGNEIVKDTDKRSLEYSNRALKELEPKLIQAGAEYGARYMNHQNTAGQKVVKLLNKISDKVYNAKKFVTKLFTKKAKSAPKVTATSGLWR